MGLCETTHNIVNPSSTYALLSACARQMRAYLGLFLIESRSEKAALRVTRKMNYFVWELQRKQCIYCVLFYFGRTDSLARLVKLGMCELHLPTGIHTMISCLFFSSVGIFHFSPPALRIYLSLECSYPQTIFNPRPFPLLTEST